MGRRIYDSNGEFVWKYTFGRQSSEMKRFSEENDIGCYYEQSFWEVEKSDIPKLKKLLKNISKGKTYSELSAIGMKAVWDFIQAQGSKWREVFAEEIKNVRTWKSDNDFEFYGSHKKGHGFEIFDIYAKGVEKYITDTMDYFLMLKAFIEYMEKSDKEEFQFADEF